MSSRSAVGAVARRRHALTPVGGGPVRRRRLVEGTAPLLRRWGGFVRAAAVGLRPAQTAAPC